MARHVAALRGGWSSALWVTATLAITLAGNAAYANDSAFADDNGTIVLQQQDAISMDKEVLEISQERIKVNYVFTNTSSTDLRVPIAFPMPPMYFGHDDHNGLTQFQLWVDGKQLQPVRQLVVLLTDPQQGGTHDVSHQVKKLGWTEADLVRFLSEEMQPKGKPELPSEWYDKYGKPLITLNEYFTWTQTFPAGKALSIRHSYAPSVETGVPLQSADFLRLYAQSACIDQRTQTAIQKRTITLGVEYGSVRYVLLTGNNWKGAIKDFTLRIKKSSPTDLISLCFAGDLVKTDALTYSFQQSDYRPTHDLNVLFIHKNALE